MGWTVGPKAAPWLASYWQGCEGCAAQHAVSGAEVTVYRSEEARLLLDSRPAVSSFVLS